MPEFGIRTGTVGDAPLLSRIGAETFLATYGGKENPDQEDILRYISIAYDEEVIRKELIDEGFRYLIAESGNEPAGYARLKIGSYTKDLAAKRPLEISRIYLLPQFQGSGLGKKLMERCFEEAERFSCDAIWLSVWRQNEKAIGFYERMGFKIAGTVFFDLAGTLHEDLMMAREV